MDESDGTFSDVSLCLVVCLAGLLVDAHAVVATTARKIMRNLLGKITSLSASLLAGLQRCVVVFLVLPTNVNLSKHLEASTSSLEHTKIARDDSALCAAAKSPSPLPLPLPVPFPFSLGLINSRETT
jgi:hypothetical protein